MNSMSEKKGGSWLVRIIFFLGVVVLTFTIFALSKETYRKKQVEKEIEALRQEAEKIRRDNLIIGDKVSYLESKDYLEKEAKDKLNMQGPDENVVVIKPSLVKKEEVSDIVRDPERPIENQDKFGNAKKWYDYFFK